MGSRDPSQSVGPSNTSPLSMPEAELITLGMAQVARHKEGSLHQQDMFSLEELQSHVVVHHQRFNCQKHFLPNQQGHN
jgi:hypothetical protein